MHKLSVDKQQRKGVGQMANKTVTKNNRHTEEELNLKGTLIAVMSLGVFIVITWIIVFDLFLGRF